MIGKTNTEKIQAKFETAQKFQDGLARFKKGGEDQADIKILTRDIVGQVINWVAVYPADRSVRLYPQNHYHFTGKIEEIL